jgi:predicted transcriptional regulator
VINKNKHTKIISLDEINKYSRALHCPTRWEIIRLLCEKELSTSEISIHLKRRFGSVGKQNLYYHLSELSSSGIIEVSDYREERGGAPEKVWHLKIHRLIIDLKDKKRK